MKAVVIEDGAVSWQERPEPVPGANDLLVRVEAAGLNGADLMQRAGHYPPPPGVPADQPGLEMAGTVVEVGPAVTDFVPGDRVMALTPGAAQAELAVVHERLAMPIPAGTGWTEAGGFPEAFCTAYDALFSQAGLALGEDLLVTGAAGGVGTAAVQLGRVTGARVVASVRSEALRPRVAALGAACLAPEEALAAGPFHVVLELVGSPGLPGALAALAPWGRAVVIGMGAGRSFDLDLGVLMTRRATLRSSSLRARPLEERAAVVKRTQHHVVPLLARAQVSVPVEQVYPFAEAQAAYQRFAGGEKFGKVVLGRA